MNQWIFLVDKIGMQKEEPQNQSNFSRNQMNSSLRKSDKIQMK